MTAATTAAMTAVMTAVMTAAMTAVMTAVMTVRTASAPLFAVSASNAAKAWARSCPERDGEDERERDCVPVRS
jgi:hypothetical protein